MGRDRKWERKGEENWGETENGKEKARRIWTRQEVGKKRRVELGRDRKLKGEDEENWGETESGKKARRIWDETVRRGELG